MRLVRNPATPIICLVSLFASCGEPKDRQAKGYTVGIVNKNDETPFYARFATTDGRFIVSDASATSAASHDFKLPANEELYIVELDQSNAPTLKTEIFRDGRIVLYTAIDERQANLIASQSYEFAHPKLVNLTNLKQPNKIAPTKTQGLQTVVIDRPNQFAVNTQYMREDLESLSGARPIVIDGQTVTLSNRASLSNKTNARAWLKSIYVSLGYKVYEHQYKSGINLIAEKTPVQSIDDQIILVSSHLDTVQTAGADDNGSGTISALTVARNLADQNLKRTLRFVAFDEEERGLIGSTAYADELFKTGDISKVSVINIEMTGFDSDNDGDFHTIDCNENSSPTLTRALLDAISAEGIALRKVEACTNRSDHAAFWEYDRPAIVMSQNFFGGDGNPCYHRACDTTKLINWEYMEKLTRATTSAVYRLAQ
jgi:hypothetical protein